MELKKSDVKKKASEFVENEAELSDEWDSADEDEKDEMNQYEAELGDSEKFDKDKLRDELERIRLYVKCSTIIVNSQIAHDISLKGVNKSTMMLVQFVF